MKAFIYTMILNKSPRDLRQKFQFFLEQLLAEHTRWILWVPVGLGVGISIYFSFLTEPWIGLGAVLIVKIAVLMRLLCRRQFYWVPILGILGVICIGFTLAQLRTHLTDAIMVDKKLEIHQLTGQIQSIEPQSHGQRLVITKISSPNLSRKIDKIRLTWRGDHLPTMSPSDWLTFDAVLMPPGDPVAPGAYDFRRQAYFEGISAVGFITSKPEEVKHSKQPQSSFLKTFSIQAIRHTINQQLLKLSGQEGAIAIALVTGDKTALSHSTRDAFANSGLAHVLAISGLHLSIVAGLVFLLVRRGFALIPPIALKYPIKKWAAVLAILATGFYLMLSGLGFPAQRSFLMTTIVMLAILMDRTALSMRLVAIAATCILVLRPEALLSASFQLSFSAVIALIAVYEGGRSSVSQWLLKPSSFRWFKTVCVYSGGILLTTLVATLATTPYTIAIFSRFTLQAFASNLCAIPLVSFWIMPSALLTLLAMPFGLEAVPLAIFGIGIELLEKVAHEVASWPGAAVPVPPPGFWYLPCITLGGLWLCLWQQRWRWWGLGGIALGFTALLGRTPPDLYISGDGKGLGILTGHSLWLSSDKIREFTQEAWLKQSMGGKIVETNPQVTCHKELCETQIKGRKIVWSLKPYALKKFCNNPSHLNPIAISFVPFYKTCPQATQLIDMRKIWDQGGMYIWIQSPDEVTIRTAFGEEKRPWRKQFTPQVFSKRQH